MNPDRIAQLVLDSADEYAVLTTDLEGRVAYWSAGAEQLFGWSESEMRGQDSCIIFTPEDQANDVYDLERLTACREGRAADERWHMRKDGTRFFASGVLMRFEDEGQHIGYIKIVRDRTAQHEAEEERRAIHRHTVEILESLSDAFYAVDDQWRLTYINCRAEQAWGRSRKELIGKVIWEEFPDAVGSVSYQAHVTAMEQREPQDLETVSPILGKWVEIDIHPTHSGGLSVYFRDIASRRARQAALEESQARLRLALDAAEMAIWELSLPGQTLAPSPGLAAFLGIPEAELEDIENVRSHYHPDDRERLRIEGEVALARGDRTFESEFRFYRSPDDLRWFLLRAEVIRDRDGNPERALGVLVDITRRKAAEDELRRIKDNLEEEVRARSSELLKTEEALRQSQKMEAIGQLTGGVAHDFNNLLTIIRSSVDLLRRPSFSEGRKTRYLDAISDTADRAAKLTGQLLAFARRQSLQPEVFDIAERTGRIADMVDTLSGARIRVELDASCGSCFVEADVAQFETAIVNLAINARDAMDGQGVLRIAVSPVTGIPAIRGHHPAKGKFIAVSVKDTGSGIAEDALPHVFEPFFTTKEVGRGTGLGLSQVYGFAKQSGGDVHVESEEGQGTTFTLFLPQSKARPAAAPESAAPEAGRVPNQTILVVEDNVDVGSFAVGLLEELGNTATLAPDGQSALKILEEKRGDFDLVFTDVVMPGMSGIELAEEVRRRYPTLRVVLTSGYSHVLATEGSHGFELLQKPYSLERLTGFLGSGAASAE
ncbi:PAS domain-containing hybrid sensor histidine kinase/response regulator [Altericroceibacterium xinjiangense]|uniref:PAS domain-containing hybrid sensor histidine kinase/response regulator n=1 Tax=Altericroceibacterium xinjiangense TaxID=762261 RepID=UPI0013DEF631|nr:PAS domain S-box protein [Altericroceibacterium xinjiangense]